MIKYVKKHNWQVLMKDAAIMKTLLLKELLIIKTELKVVMKLVNNTKIVLSFIIKVTTVIYMQQDVLTPLVPILIDTLLENAIGNLQKMFK